MRAPLGLALAAAAFVLLAAAPLWLGPYGVGLLIGMTGYVTLASAWALFSGRTGYVSLATVAFFGIGAYAVAVFSETLPYPLVLLTAAAAGLAVALLVGLSTLRLAGVYFVIFTFGLAELVRQLVTFYETTITGTLGRYIFLPVTPEQIYWQLLALCAVTLLVTWAIDRSRWGLALRAIADDELVAAHLGIDIARLKIALFALSATIISLVGAIQAPRWTYVEPSIVFNPTTSFLTLIMALLGGAGRLWGPALGAIPLFLLFEWLSANFPNHYPILLGLLFIVIVFLLPRGVTGLLDRRGAGHDRAPRPRRPDPALRRPHRGQRRLLHRERGRGHRPPRPERLGQDHRAQHDLRRAPPQRRRDPAARRAGRRPRAAPHRPQGHRPHLPARAHPALAQRRRERDRRPRLPPRLPARPRRPRRR
jgi:branched-chain amino acid transport system permease protein